MSDTYLATITKVAEIEVNLQEATDFLICLGDMPASEIERLTPEEIIEIYVSHVEGISIEPGFDRFIACQTKLAV